MDGPDIHLLAAGTHLPGPPLDTATLVRRFDLPAVWEQWIDTYVGTQNRHFCVDIDTGEVRQTLADMGEAAAVRAMSAAGVRADDIDLIVMGTATPDQLMPATVNRIAERLGIDRVPSYQLQSGCTGAVQALSVAHRMLRSGPERNALVLGAETSAKFFDPAADIRDRPPAEQINGLLFGDGAGALVLSKEPGPASAVLRDVHVELVGLGREPGQILDWYGRTTGEQQGMPVAEDYKAIEETVPKLATQTFERILERLDWDETDLDYLLPPQLSGRMTQRITEGLNAPGAHEISCVAEIGNTGNALPFFQVERLLPRMAPGDRALAVSVESSKWIQAGFALEKPADPTPSLTEANK
ncbi:3-oxoacyl-ACP synthase III family protein [Streptomyces sp. NPDC046976]|uniref:3-oxoacyl-ACP synthase III family protein n=1 Tax=Streptomyces sp. NPDC046976 TaxID=3155258 RepID=UPI0033C3EB48